MQKIYYLKVRLRGPILKLCQCFVNFASRREHLCSSLSRPRNGLLVSIKYKNTGMCCEAPKHTTHRRRIETEEKAKVVASVWGKLSRRRIITEE